jgi:ABC-type transport system involved in multi-copper enzyme maturation permease subunit
VAILTITRLTLREAARRRLIIAVILLTIAVDALAGWGFQHLLASLRCNGAGAGPACSPVEARIISATLLILIIFMLSFVFSLAAVFVAAPSISGDIESGIAFALLPRPIRRSDVVLGKWLGLSILIGGYTLGTTGLLLIIVAALTGYVPPHPVEALVFLIGESVALLLLALLGSTRLSPMTCGIIVLVLFGVAWIGGIAEGVGIAVQSDSVTNAGLATSLLLPTDGLWRGALFNLEPAALVAAAGSGRSAAANPFLVGAPPSTAYIVWAVVWMAIVLALTILSFSRREL